MEKSTTQGADNSITRETFELIVKKLGTVYRTDEAIDSIWKHCQLYHEFQSVEYSPLHRKMLLVENANTINAKFNLLNPKEKLVICGLCNSPIHEKDYGGEQKDIGSFHSNCFLYKESISAIEKLKEEISKFKEGQANVKICTCSGTTTNITPRECCPVHNGTLQQGGEVVVGMPSDEEIEKMFPTDNFNSGENDNAEELNNCNEFRQEGAKVLRSKIKSINIVFKTDEEIEKMFPLRHTHVDDKMHWENIKPKEKRIAYKEAQENIRKQLSK